MKSIVANRGTRLFIVLGAVFLANALVAEFIGVKIFSLEGTLGIPALNWNLTGLPGALNFTAGVLLWPFVFVLTDIVNDYFGVRGVRFLSILTACLISYAFLMVYLATALAPAEWWVGVSSGQGVPDMQAAFAAIFGQSGWIIVGSLVAFLVGQLLDAYVFFRIRRLTGDRNIWVRATVSTLVSQFVDSFVVLYIAFVLGPQHWPIPLFLAVGTVNYLYKFLAAVALVPVLYGVHGLIERYLGAELSAKLRAEARGN
jgi:uncharacterized integral membrane protein (TIGR00697 family)